jgi:hypothetical protein
MGDSYLLMGEISRTTAGPDQGLFANKKAGPSFRRSGRGCLPEASIAGILFQALCLRKSRQRRQATATEVVSFNVFHFPGHPMAQLESCINFGQVAALAGLTG